MSSKMTDTVYLGIKSSFLGSLPRSDTLFGAICWGIKLVKGEDTLLELLESFSYKKPPFIISSSFPFINLADGKLHFLPKPLSEPLNVDPYYLCDFRNMNKLEDLDYVSDDIYNDIINGKTSLETIYNSIEDYFLSSGYLVKKEDRNDFSAPLETRTVQRNKINRLTNTTHEGGLFYSSEITCSKDGGLFFLLQGKEEALTLVRAALRFLQDRGIGGDISVGKGNFELEIAKGFSPVKEPKESDYFTTLSLTYLEDDQWNNLQDSSKTCLYRLERRRGRIESSLVSTSNIWKQAVIVFKEGSVFPLTETNTIYGCNPIVKQKPFPVQYYGFSYPVRYRKGG